ncbi:MAG: 2-succinyl-5-enolpyruvyl-6-hydroxy-3-cyclohexene-1-carboxylic-acid synthase [Cyanobacteria bacterium P01_D01_bin.105]
MSIDFRNTNTLWASVAVETLARLGLQTAVVCPGSRSTPLTVALARHPDIEALPMLDERAAAFFALGCAKRQRCPVALVCTSGTAGANFYPAVIEAYESAVPLLILTADRPHELRDCASGQTIDQQRLYGNFVKHYSELAVPVASEALLAYLRQTLVSAWRRAVSPLPGPIHLNCPFRDPLPPIADTETSALTQALSTSLDEAQFFSAVVPLPLVCEQPLRPIENWPIENWQQCERGIIVAGPVEPAEPVAYCQAVAMLAEQLGWPVLAEGLSPLRNYRSLNSALISTYDSILRNVQRADTLAPDRVIQLGPLPISKVLRQWLQRVNPQRWVIGSPRNLDPLHGATYFLSTSVAVLARQVAAANKAAHKKEMTLSRNNNTDYRQRWIAGEQLERQRLDQRLEKENALVESKVAWLLSQHLPTETPLFIANSMPVRDVEYFWQVGDRHIQPYFSRGANGIDGTLSTAMGIAHNNQPTVLLTGDLAFLHDTNGLLNISHLRGHLTIVLINNNGGGIFEMLPISQFEPEFETYFVTPQRVNFEQLCATYGVEYQKVEAIDRFVSGISTLPKTGLRLLEVVCDRKQSVRQRKALLADGANPWPM